MSTSSPALRNIHLSCVRSSAVLLPDGDLSTELRLCLEKVCVVSVLFLNVSLLDVYLHDVSTGKQDENTLSFGHKSPRPEIFFNLLWELFSFIPGLILAPKKVLSFA